MIFSCRQCDARFDVDESRIPADGIRVRCSHCKEAFFIRPPAEQATEALHAVAQRSLCDDSFRIPEPACDLDADPLEESSASPEDTANGSASGSDEADWQFNLDSPEFTNLEADLSDPISPSLDIDMTLGDGGPHLDPAEVEPDRDESAFGSVDDFSKWLEDDPESVVEPLSTPPVTEKICIGDLGTPATQRSSNPLGAAPLVTGADDRYADPAWQNDDSGSDPSPATNTFGRASRPLPTDSFEGGSIEDLRRRRAWLNPLLGIGRAIGWSMTVGLLGIGLASGLQRGIEAGLASPQTVIMEHFSAEGLRGHWRTNAAGTEVLVVTGNLRNRSESPREPGGRVTVSLLPSEDLPLSRASSWATLAGSGSALEPKWASATPGSESLAADRLAGTTVEVGESVPIRAVFRDVGAHVARLGVAIELHPGKSR